MLIRSLVFIWAAGNCPLQQAPVPDVEKQKQAEAIVRDVFKTEYAKKTTPERVALARKLLAQAQETSDDPISRFVLLREAREVAAQAGDLATVMKAIDATGKSYDVEPLSLKAAAYLAVGKVARTTEELKALGGAYLDLADEAGQRNQFEIAKQAAESAAALARRAKDLPMASRADAKAKEAGDRREKFAKVKVAQETLAASPDDLEANLLVGQFECWVKGDWEQGLPLLAKGSDAALSALAREDLASPSDASARIKVGDGWWELAEKAEASHKARMQERARHWYRQAVAEAQGLSKAKLEGRLKGNWVPIFDGKSLDFMRDGSKLTWEVVDGVLCKRPTLNEGFQTRQLFQDGEIRIRFENKGLKHMTFSVRQGDGGRDAIVFVEPRTTELEGKIHELLFQCRGPEVKASLDGQPIAFDSRGPVAEGHIQIVGNGLSLKIYSLEYRQVR